MPLYFHYSINCLYYSQAVCECVCLIGNCNTVTLNCIWRKGWREKERECYKHHRHNSYHCQLFLSLPLNFFSPNGLFTLKDCSSNWLNLHSHSHSHRLIVKGLKKLTKRPECLSPFDKSVSFNWTAATWATTCAESPVHYLLHDFIIAALNFHLFTTAWRVKWFFSLCSLLLPSMLLLPLMLLLLLLLRLLWPFNFLFSRSNGFTFQSVL